MTMQKFVQILLAVIMAALVSPIVAVSLGLFVRAFEWAAF
jgi:hypothetical protein